MITENALKSGGAIAQIRSAASTATAVAGIRRMTISFGRCGESGPHVINPETIKFVRTLIAVTFH
jgi:hypothetical protein